MKIQLKNNKYKKSLTHLASIIFICLNEDNYCVVLNSQHFLQEWLTYLDA